MKQIKNCLFLMGLFCIPQVVFAQTCYIPKPMTAGQIETVKGIWKGTYFLDGKEIPVTLSLYAAKDTKCFLDVPPVDGKETGEPNKVL